MPVARFVQRSLAVLFFLAPILLASVGLAQSSDAETIGDRPTWWLHPDVSTNGHEIDYLFYIIFWMTVIVGILVFIVLGVFLVQYRYNPNRHARYIHGNARLEIVWTLVPALLMALTAAISQSTWAKIKNPPVGPNDGDWPTPALMVEKVTSGDVVHVQVVARQFNWLVHYPGPDGKLGPRKLDLIKQGTNEDAIGLDRSHPDADDDVVLSALVVPVGKRIFIDLVSVDVLHSFYLPNFRIKQDAVPGLRGKVWFQATRTSAEVIGKVSDDFSTGEQRDYFGRSKPFEIVCAELCGAQHWSMAGYMYVLTQDQYDRYITAQYEARKQIIEEAAKGAAGGDDYE